eukprot:COSAG06_NODE_11409_length_1514_cov_3.047350_1_plen_34_part_10
MVDTHEGDDKDGRVLGDGVGERGREQRAAEDHQR